MKPENFLKRPVEEGGRRLLAVPENDGTLLKRIERRAIALGVMAFALFYLLPLTFHGLWIPDEPRYAQIAQEMLLSGNWVSPHFMGIRYFEKPIAGYWMIAIGQALFGDNLFGVRIASAASTGLSIVLTYLMARRLWNDPRKSVAAALIYMSFGLIAGQAGYANLDPQFTFWVNLSFVAFWFAIDSPRAHHRLMSWGVVGLACGMGFMTKGFLAWLLPALIAVPYMIWQRRLGELMRYGPLAVVVAVAVCVSWVLKVNAQEPDFWNFFFWNEHIRRFSADDAQHARPWWFYVPLLVVSSLPWAALLPTALLDAWKHKRHAGIGFLLLWCVLPLVLLSFSRGKLPTYIMPCLLPLALLMGDSLIGLLSRAKERTLRINGLLNVAIALIGLFALVYLQMTKPVYGRTETAGLSLALIVLFGWIFTNALQALKPLVYWAAPALGIGLLVALLPAAMPADIVASKMPDQFIAEHLVELNQASSLLSNDLGAASALSWRLRRPDVNLYNTVGELKYGIAYPDSAHRRVDADEVGLWMREARKLGSVGVVMRVNAPGESREIDLLPQDGKRYERGNMIIVIFPKKG